ncbi:MAG: hypothetical protein ACFHU9_00660 [Fluviicola sp.]
MEVQLSINYIKSASQSSADFWWKDLGLFEDLIETINNSEITNFKYFWADNAFYNIDESVLLNELIEGNDIVYLCQHENIDSNYAEFYLNNDSIGINILLNTDEQVHQLNGLKKLVVDFYKKYQEIVSLGPSVKIFVPFTEFPRLRPIRDYKGLGEWSVINFIDPVYEKSHPETQLTGYEALLNEKLPSGVTREEVNGLHIIQWADSINDEDSLHNTLMKREDFIYEHLELELFPDFNEYGDENIYHISALDKTSEEESFFNYYDEEDIMAFKLLTLDKDFKMDQETEDKIQHYVETESLDSGETVEDIVLILPSRESAAAIEERAIEIGVYKVLYLDSDGEVWSMRPFGNWRN